ncbi:N-acetylmuramoyl-L-alanine amidase [Sulfurimonas sp. CS5]|uniref:N-acetylmuramoyl-L-alanine amidase n=1 Tax=Sulfurimonas sp. CS5 TaxID=3391145 RepID=UPI0039EA98B4
MLKFILLPFLLFNSIFAFEIKDTPINFGKLRIELTKSYINEHYGFKPKDITITPKIIVIHYTGINSFEKSLERFTPALLLSDRPDISGAGVVNVSAHFLVDIDGTIHQLMPVDYMARHVIGLNYSSIGIENVGGENHKQNLTIEQLISNIKLVKYLKKEFNTIEYVVGHYEYRCFEGTKLWLENNNAYRTKKRDPGENFMRDLKANLKNIKFAPCD